jgi:hypothetical protein
MRKNIKIQVQEHGCQLRFISICVSRPDLDISHLRKSINTQKFGTNNRKILSNFKGMDTLREM